MSVIDLPFGLFSVSGLTNMKSIGGAIPEVISPIRTQHKFNTPVISDCLISSKRRSRDASTILPSNGLRELECELTIDDFEDKSVRPTTVATCLMDRYNLSPEDRPSNRRGCRTGPSFRGKQSPNPDFCGDLLKTCDPACSRQGHSGRR